MKLDHSLTPYTTITPNWLKDLDVRQESMKILEENIGSNLYDIGHSNLFHDTSPRARKTKEKNELVGLLQGKKLLHSQGYSQKTMRQPTEWENIFAKDTTDERLVSKIYKELPKLNTQETNNQINKWAEDMNRHFPNT